MSRSVVRALGDHPDRASDPDLPATLPAAGSLVHDEDFQLALWTLYELHFRGFEDSASELEWAPLVLHARRTLELVFELELRELTRHAVADAGSEPDTVTALRTLTEPGQVPGVAAYLQRRATREDARDFLRERSIYQLRESDPQSFVLPRIDGPAKVALAELQYDEYGAGRPEMLHSALFARALDAAGLDDEYGAHIDHAHATTLAVTNAMSLFALHRRLRGASLGHLAAFEATSTIPCRMIAHGMERLDFPPDVAAYFHEHVEADAVHEQVAITDICGSLVADEPDLAGDVLFGAATCLHLDDVAGGVLLAAWQRGADGADGAARRTERVSA